MERGWWLGGCEVITHTLYDLNLTEVVAVETREGHREHSNVRSDRRVVNWLRGKEKKGSGNYLFPIFQGQ